MLANHFSGTIVAVGAALVQRTVAVDVSQETAATAARQRMEPAVPSIRTPPADLGRRVVVVAHLDSAGAQKPIVASVASLDATHPPQEVVARR